jgi:shikimate dehydrogenase
VAIELALAHAAQFTIVNRSADRGHELVQLIRDRTDVSALFVHWEGKYQVPDNADLLVNTTSVGLFPDVEARLPLDLETLRPGLIVCDVIPNPPQTQLLRDAHERGCTTVDGLGMLVNQGVIGIRLWTQSEPSPQVMRQALLEVFS